jgi:hypothetical protein
MPHQALARSKKCQLKLCFLYKTIPFVALLNCCDGCFEMEAAAEPTILSNVGESPGAVSQGF